MEETGSDLAQVLSLEVEGIKIILGLSKDALGIAKQLSLFLLNSFAEKVKKVPYRKTSGATNIKNFKARASGQAVMPYAMGWEEFQKFQKYAPKYGILYRVVEPLRSGKKNGCVHVMFMESDIPGVKDIMERIKEEMVRENVKKGMSKEEAEADFDNRNSPETMQEFAENVGVMTPPETFDADMRAMFGDDYEKKFDKLEVPKAAANSEYMDALAKRLSTKSRMEEREKEKTVDFQFEYDVKNRKSHIVETTDSHIKVRMSENGRMCVWIPKDAVFPPLDQSDTKGGMRTAKLKENDVLLLQDIESKEVPYQISAQEFSQTLKERNEKARESVTSAQKKGKVIEMPQNRKPASHTKDKAQGDSKDITIAKELIRAENDHAVKTRIPGMWGENARYLWINKENTIDIHDGKTILSSLENEKEYKLYSEDNRVVGTMKGKDLYKGHYDSVEPGVRKAANQTKLKRAGRG